MGKTLGLYDKDFYAWTQMQVELLKRKAFDQLDTTHLLEEIDSMGKREKRELNNRLEILLMHLLKWKYQPDYQSKSWLRTIKEQRHQIYLLLNDNPSLKSMLSTYIENAYKYARSSAHEETGVFLEHLPTKCEWQEDKIFDNNFLP